MAHESVIGNNQLIFTISITNSFRLVSECMSQAQLDSINHHDVLDGYIVPAGAIEIAHEFPLVNGTFEPFASGAYAFFPFLNWHKNVYIRSVSGTISARQKLMTGFIRRNI